MAGWLLQSRGHSLRKGVSKATGHKYVAVPTAPWHFQKTHSLSRLLINHRNHRVHSKLSWSLLLQQPITCKSLRSTARHSGSWCHLIESSLRPMRVRKPPRKVHLYKKAGFNRLRDELSAYLPEFIEETANIYVDHTWKAFENKLKSLISKYIPTKTLSGNKVQKPWITKTIKSLHRKRNKFHSKFTSTGSLKDRYQYLQAKKETQKQERQEYWRYIENLIEVDPTNTEQHSKQFVFLITSNP